MKGKFIKVNSKELENMSNQLKSRIKLLFMSIRGNSRKDLLKGEVEFD